MSVTAIGAVPGGRGAGQHSAAGPTTAAARDEYARVV